MLSLVLVKIYILIKGNYSKKFFKCKVFEKYGTRESGIIACECPIHNGMHIFTEGVYLEFIKDGRQALPGEMGEIIVTDLFNYGCL